MLLYAQAVDFPVVFGFGGGGGWLVCLFERGTFEPKGYKGGFSLQVVWISGIHSGHK